MTDPDPRVELALRESWSTLAAQADHLKELQTRTTAALTLGTVAVGLVHNQVFPQDRICGASWLPLLGIGVMLLCAGVMAIPRNWSFHRKPAYFESAWARNHTYAQMMATLYRDAVKAYDSNRSRLRCLEVVYAVCVGALAFTLATTVVAIA